MVQKAKKNGAHEVWGEEEAKGFLANIAADDEDAHHAAEHQKDGAVYR